MGLSDDFLKPRYKQYLSKFLKGSDKFSDIKVAWLGQQDPNDKSLNGTAMFYNLISLFDGHCQHDFYDIENENPWEVHDEWKISNYDLVLCFRLTYLVQSSSHLLRELKKTANNNKLVICDFVSGNVIENIIKWNNPNNLICHLPEYYLHKKVDLGYSVTSDDHLLNKKMLNEAGLEIEDYTSFKGPKGRHYVIGRVVDL